jgi:flavodoxin
MTRTIVTFFSATGTTEMAAEALAKAGHAELYRIEPTERYTRLVI